jgi:hypothetical protein
MEVYKWCMQKGKKQEQEEEGHLEGYKCSTKCAVLKTGSTDKM